MNSSPIVLAITGASGVIYAARTLEWLMVEGRQVHLVVSPDGATVIEQELDFRGALEPSRWLEFFEAAWQAIGLTDGSHRHDSHEGKGTARKKLESALAAGQLMMHHAHDYYSPIASGSYRTAAMLICPCSGSTLAAISQGNGRNLIHRAAEVHLKERRKLVLVPREAPLSIIQIENMLRVSRAGAIVLPASPGWYHGVGGLQDLVDFVAARILDQIDIAPAHVKRWGEAIGMKDEG